MVLDIKNIIDLLPHRYPLLLVDRIIDIKPGKEITGLKNVTFNEHFFVGHFPSEPVMPGVLIIESMAQVSAVLVGHDLKSQANNKTTDNEAIEYKQDASSNIVYFMSIEEAKFRKIVTPGDTLIIKSEIIQARSNVWKFAAKAFVEDKVVAQASFTAMLKSKK